MTMTDTPKGAVERPAFEPGGAGVGVWVATSFVALVALAVSVAALVVSVSHETKKVVTSAVATATTAAPNASGAPTVLLSDYKVDVGASTFKPGMINFTIANGGKTEHELLVFRTDIAPAGFPLDTDGDISEAGPGINKISDGENIAPGATQSRTVDLSQPGTYVFVCNLPGHFKAGMYQAITVK